MRPLLGASYKFPFFISLGVHFLFLMLVCLLSVEHQSYLNLSPMVYQVKLVDISSLKKASGGRQKAKPGGRKIAKSTARVKKRYVSKTSKKKVSPGTRHKKARTTKAISLRKSKTRTKSKKVSEEALITRRIKRIEKQVRERQRKEVIPKEVAKIAQEIRESGAGGVIGEFANGKPTGRGISLSFQLYHAQIEEQIMKNWILPTFLLKREQALEAIVVIRISRNGHITKIKFEKKSGNSLFDRSVKEAIKNSDPLFPLPKDYTQPYYEVGFRFRWPKGKLG